MAPSLPSAHWQRALYRVVLTLALPFAWLRLAWRARHTPALRLGWCERRGDLPDEVIARARGGVWVHAVSAGETITAAPLVRSLSERFPALPILLTTTTHTGRERAAALLPMERIAIAYAPYDSAAAATRFVRAVQPRLVVLMETELWPHTLDALHRAHVPVVLANARLSERSARRYGWAAALSRRMVGQLAFVAAQSDAHGRRFLSLGVPAERLGVLGSLKYDVAQPAARAASVLRSWQAVLAGRPVWIAGSTHPGEEERLLEAHRRLRLRLPGAVLVLVPRHPERAPAVASLCGNTRWAYASRPDAIGREGIDVLIGDRMGELATLYSLAAVAFVGGSLVPHGGHTPVEPAHAGAAILFGPNVHNFADIYETFVAAGGARCVTSDDALLTALIHWFRDPHARGVAVAAARGVVAAQRGATERTLTLLDRWLADATSSR